jgi:cyclic beta-1,2-glucan synthetase
VPILLSTRDALEEQLERLEIHHLAGPERELHFALLSDWTEAPAGTAAQDQALLDAAAEGIARLNRQYGPAAGGERFLLFHRRRVWSESQQCWMGWERKRGKLHELNRLLRGATDTTFVGVSAPPSGVRYVITLDADTRMPRDAARRLVGKMAHPLNQPRFDAAARRVVEGYGVLQPRVTPSLPVGREGSLYQRIFSSVGGIDPYESAVSDVYQDLFGEGSYTGKGIYDLDAFEAALEGRVREGTLLSHDLFEGTFARAGLASDIEVVEEFPSRYDVAAARQHRWVRGDWQLLPWIAGRAGALPPIGRWKMLDNLRRSLSTPACVIALAAGWALPLHAAVLWTGFVVSTIAVATLVPILSAIVPRRARTTARSHLHALAVDVRLALSLTALLLVFLAHQAWLMADAIGRTLYRLLVSRRRLLDWVTAEQAQVGPRLDLSGFTRLMGGGVALGSAAAIGAAWVGGEAWPVALPFRARLDRLARHCALDEPVAARRRPRAGLARGRARIAADRAPHLALLRDVRDGRRELAAARQLSGGTAAAGDRASHVADEYRPVSAVDHGGARFRLARPRRRGRSAACDLRDDAQDVPVPRSPVQLVRYAEPQTARSAVCVERRQRQSCRASDRPRQRMPRVDARSAGGRRGDGFRLSARPGRQLLSIGYLVAEGKLDPSCYDLLASEARLASFVAIAKGDVAARHWFRLGRAVTPVGRAARAVSWSGSMFEYLMPSLVMRAPAGSLLEQTNRLIVRRQIAYGAAWRALGHLGIGLQRARPRVHLPVLEFRRARPRPEARARRERRHRSLRHGPGGHGRSGRRHRQLRAAERRRRGSAATASTRRWTTPRAPAGRRGRRDRPRLHGAPPGHDGGRHRQRAARRRDARALPRRADGARRPSSCCRSARRATSRVAHPRAEEVRPRPTSTRPGAAAAAALRTRRTSVSPVTHLLSNGSYAVMVTAAGSGYSRWNDIAVTRWREDVTLRRLGHVRLPARHGERRRLVGRLPADRRRARQLRGRPSPRIAPRSSAATATSPPRSRSRSRPRTTPRSAASRSPTWRQPVREIEVTSYAELVLARRRPTRRTRPSPSSSCRPSTSPSPARSWRPGAAAGGEPEVWAAHLAVVEGEAVGEPSSRPIARASSAAAATSRTPISVMDGQPLSGTVGRCSIRSSALRRRLRIAPGATARVAFWTMVAVRAGRARPRRQASRRRGLRPRGDAGVDPGAGAARHLGIGRRRRPSVPAPRRPRALRRSDAAPVAGTAAPRRRRPRRSGRTGISGDLPIVLVRIDDAEDGELVRQLLRAHEYWRMKQLAVDLVILNERAVLRPGPAGRARDHGAHEPVAPARAGNGRARRVFVLRADLVPARSARCCSPPRAVLVSRRGTLAGQLDRLDERRCRRRAGQLPRRRRAETPARQAAPATRSRRMQLEFFNGLGGFAEDGPRVRDHPRRGQWTPAPWVNVSPTGFGFQVAAEGGGYTWSGNSRENQLTPWSNDPVGDRPGRGDLRSRRGRRRALVGPTALPIRDESGTYVARHGQGYSRFEHTPHGIAIDLLQYVPLEDPPIKISRLTIRTLGRTRL